MSRKLIKQGKWEILCLITNETIQMNMPNRFGNLERLVSWNSKADAQWAIKKLVLYYNSELAEFLETSPGMSCSAFEISNHQPLTIFDFEVVKAHTNNNN